MISSNVRKKGKKKKKKKKRKEKKKNLRNLVLFNDFHAILAT